MQGQHKGRRAVAMRQGVVRRRALWSTGAVGVFVLVLGVMLFARPAPVPPLEVGDRPYVGAADAAVDAFLFIDYQCPACQRFEVGGAFDALQRDHGARVRFVVVDFPFIGEDSWHAAVASDEVWRQAPAAWPAWSRGLYAAQRGENDGWASVAGLVAYSREHPTIDIARLEAVLLGDDRTDVEADARAGQEHGVVATPTLVVGTQRMNALDDAAVRAALERALAEAGP